MISNILTKIGFTCPFFKGYLIKDFNIIKTAKLINGETVFDFARQ